MWQTCALLIALATAGTPAARLAPLGGEPPRAFECRAAHVPEGRACLSRCEAALPASDPDAAWECQLSCSRRTLHAIADCRRTPPKAPGAAAIAAPAAARATPLASR